MFITDPEASLLLTHRVNKPTDVIFRLLSQNQESLGAIAWASIQVILLLLLLNNLLSMYQCIFVKKIGFTGNTLFTFGFLKFYFYLFFVILDQEESCLSLAFSNLSTSCLGMCFSSLLFIFFLNNSIGKQEFLAVFSVGFFFIFFFFAFGSSNI